MQSLVTEKELSDILKISKVTLWQYRYYGMPYIRIGKRSIRYIMDDVMDWLKEQSKRSENDDKAI